MTGQPPDSGQASTTTASVAPLRNRDPFATNVLVMINIIIFLLLWTGDPHERAEWYKWGSMSGFAFASGEWWRPLTAIFLHLNWSHVLWNMAILWFFGRLVERKIGHLALLLLYLGAALAGTLSFLISPLSGKIGASAGVLGVMGAFCVLFVRTLPRLPGKRRLILYCSLSISFLSYMAPLPVPLMAHLLGFFDGHTWGCGFPEAQSSRETIVESLGRSRHGCADHRVFPIAVPPESDPAAG